MEYNNHKVWRVQILWGRNRAVICIPPNQRLLIVSDDIIIISLPEETSDIEKTDFLKIQLKEFLKKEIEILMPKCEQITGLKCSSWFIGKSKSVWGWYRTSTGRIMLNEKLIYKPKECLEYVILHELCHLD